MRLAALRTPRVPVPDTAVAAAARGNKRPAATR